MPRLNMNLKTLDKQNCYQWMPFNASFSSNRKKSFKEKHFSTIAWKFKALYEIL